MTILMSEFMTRHRFRFDTTAQCQRRGCAVHTKSVVAYVHGHLVFVYRLCILCERYHHLRIQITGKTHTTKFLKILDPRRAS